MNRERKAAPFAMSRFFQLPAFVVVASPSFILMRNRRQAGRDAIAGDRLKGRAQRLAMKG